MHNCRCGHFIADVALSAASGSGNLDIRVEDVPNTPGMYFEHQTEARLHSSEGKVTDCIRSHGARN